eukprot:5099617-Pleurochrysis_carterae.AAC.1
MRRNPRMLDAWMLDLLARVTKKRKYLRCTLHHIVLGVSVCLQPISQARGSERHLMFKQVVHLTSERHLMFEICQTPYTT